MSRRGFGIIVFLLFADSKPFQPCQVLRINDADLQMKVSCLPETLDEIPSQYSDEHVAELHVSSNKITSLGNSSFVGYDNVKVIGLNNNKINTIDTDAFRHLEQLSTLSLAGNNLGFIAPDLFANCSSLRKLILKGNNFKLVSLQQHSFLVTSTLASLDLSYCKLEQLPETFFSETPKLAIIYVGHNFLKSLGPETFKPLKHLTKVNLDENPLECTCELRDTLLLFQKRNVSVVPAAMECSLGNMKVKLSSFISEKSCQAEATRQHTSEVPVHTEQPSTTEYSERNVASQKSRRIETAAPYDGDKTATTENVPLKENSEEDSASLSQKINQILEQQKSMSEQINEMKTNGDVAGEQQTSYLVWPYLVAAIVMMVVIACYHQRGRVIHLTTYLFNNRQQELKAPHPARQDETSTEESSTMLEGETPRNQE